MKANKTYWFRGCRCKIALRSCSGANIGDIDPLNKPEQARVYIDITRAINSDRLYVICMLLLGNDRRPIIVIHFSFLYLNHIFIHREVPIRIRHVDFSLRINPFGAEANILFFMIVSRADL